MNELTLRVLEYSKVLRIVAGYAASDAGGASVAAMVPAADRQTAQDLLRETQEFSVILRNGERPPFDGIFAIASALEKLGAAGSVFTPQELLHTAATLGAGRRIKWFLERFDKKGTETRPAAPSLIARASRIRPLKHLEDAVHAVIDERAEVKDSASPDLRRVRKQIARTRDDILGCMSGILQESAFQKVIQEPVITIRDDRYVLPLKPGFRQSIRGVVHGQSGSRATLFVEPLDILEQNNRLAELRMEEREEVERILRELTSLLAREREAIGETVAALAAIDAIHARARFGIDYEGTIPALVAERRIRLRGARHPLLIWKQKTAVGGSGVTPNDLELKGNERALILSGPNAGGKTVILKTVGLLSLMAQSGLPVTAAEGSELPCFSSVYADIGDEQSLEADLSTFSSHASQIADILRRAEGNSLVLLDELGTGTDPSEGAGLGAAVLESLIERGCVTLATTHYNALKLFGSQTSGAVNAAMEFDPQTLKPTYRLIPHRPGRSYGLDMAARLGVPETVINSARTRISTGDARLEDLLRQIEADAREVARERLGLSLERTALQQALRDAENARTTAREEARNIKTQARMESREIIAALRTRLRELSRSASVERSQIREAAAEVDAFIKRLQPSPAQGVGDSGPSTFSEYHAGDRIRIARVQKTGTVLSSRRGVLEIEIDGKKIRLPSSGVLPLQPDPEGRTAAATPGWRADIEAGDGTPDRLNIIGFRVDEGIAAVARCIDRAAVSGLTVVTVIHGLGTGALRSAVTKFLKEHPLVAGVRSGEPAEGGAGVTVAELKQ